MSSSPKNKPGELTGGQLAICVSLSFVGAVVGCFLGHPSPFFVPLGILVGSTPGVLLEFYFLRSGSNK